MEVEREPLPIELRSEELEIVWRGLLYSVKAGYITKEDATEVLEDWDNDRESRIIYQREDTGL